MILSEVKANLVCYCYDFYKNLVFKAENNHILVNNTGFDVVVISFLEYNEAMKCIHYEKPIVYLITKIFPTYNLLMVVK